MDEQEVSHQYLAFISYRHADNKQTGRQWATWLHQAIETYDIPKDLVGQKNGRGEYIPERIFPIFRDEEELPADADLANAITRALDNTELLIVLCSPNAVASTYVADEIDYFKKLGRSDNIIAAMIAGEPNASWDTSKHAQGFTPADECFPKPLQYAYNEQGEQTDSLAEPLAADFRINHDGVLQEGWASIEAYKQHLKLNRELSVREISDRVTQYYAQQQLMLLKIIAGIIGVPLGALTKRDQAYQLELAKQKAKKLRQWLSGVALLAIIAIVAGVMAFFAQQEAEKNEQIATEQRDASLLNQSRFLMDRARQANDDGEHDLALLLGLNALPGKYGGERPILDDVGQLRRAIYATNKVFHYQGSETFSQVEFDNKQGIYALSNGKLQYVLVNQAGEGKVIAPQQYIVAFNVSVDGTLLATVSNKGRITLWDTDTYTSQKTTTIKADIKQLLISPDNSTVYSIAVMNRIMAWSVDENKVVFDKATSDTYVTGKIKLSPDGKYLLVSSRPFGNARVFSTENGELVSEIELVNYFTVSNSLARQLSFTADSKAVIIYDAKGTRVQNILTGEVAGESADMHTVMNSAGDLMLALSTFQTVPAENKNAEFLRTLKTQPALWNIKENTGGPLKNIGDVQDGAFTNDGDMLITISYKTVNVWDVKTQDKMNTFTLQSTDKLKLKDNLLLGLSESGKSILIWQLKNSAAHYPLPEATNQWGRRFSADATQLLLPDSNKSQHYYLYDTQSRKTKYSFSLCDSGRLEENSWFTSGRYLMVKCNLMSKVFDLQTQEYLEFDPSVYHNIRHSTLSADETKMVLFSDDWKNSKVYVLDFASRTLLNEFELPENSPSKQLIISDTGRYALFTTYRGDESVVYNLETSDETSDEILKIEKMTYPPSSFFIDSVNRLVIQTSKRSLAIYHTQSGELLDELSFDSDVLSYIPQRNDAQLIVGLKDKEIIVYDVTALHEKLRFNTTEEADNLTLSLSNKYVIINKGQPSIYDLTSGQLFYQSQSYQEIALSFNEQTDKLLTISNEGKLNILPAMSNNITQAAIKALPLKRVCLTQKEREENFISPLTTSQRQTRGCY